MQPDVGARHLEPVDESNLAPEGDASGHWTADEIASFLCHPGSGRILTVRPGTADVDAFEHVLSDAGYRIGRLPITRDTSHLPHAAATFMPHVIYVTLAEPRGACLEALELLGADARTHDVPLVAIIEPDVDTDTIEDAYTRSGCDFLRTDASPVEYLARTHLLARLSHMLGEVPDPTSRRLHERPRAGAANDDPRAPMSLLDADSGAYSAQYLAQRLPTEIARATRYERDLSVLLVSSEAAEATAVAARITSRLREHCRETDLIARADFTHFVVLLPETPAEGARTLGSRVSAALAGEGLHVRCETVAAEAPVLARILGG